VKDKSSGDACPDGNDSAPSPIREDAKGKCHQAASIAILIKFEAIVSCPLPI